MINEALNKIENFTELKISLKEEISDCEGCFILKIEL